MESIRPDERMRYEPLPWALSGVDFAGSIQRMVVVEVDTPHGLARADVHAAGRPRAALVIGHGAAEASERSTWSPRETRRSRSA